MGLVTQQVANVTLLSSFTSCPSDFIHSPTLSSSYVRYPGGTCSVGHIRSASIAFLEGKCPAQEGRAEGLPSGNHVTHAPLLEGLRWFPRTLGLSESCLSGREPALVLLVPLFLFLIISLKQLLKIPAHGQETEPSWEATCLYQAPQALLCSAQAQQKLLCAWMMAG